MFKKKLFPFLLAAAVVATPSAVAQATAGEWDPIDVDSYFGYSSKTVYSHGGDFMVCMDQNDSWYGYITLWEDDGTLNPQQVQSPKYLSPSTCAVWRDIGGYVDGDNKLAEFYVSRESHSGAITLVFFD